MQRFNIEQFERIDRNEVRLTKEINLLKEKLKKLEKILSNSNPFNENSESPKEEGPKKNDLFDAASIKNAIYTQIFIVKADVGDKVTFVESIIQRLKVDKL